MPHILRILLAVLLLQPALSVAAEPAVPDHPIAIVIHGGAGTITRKDMTPEMDAEYRAALKQALEAGYTVLKQGGRSLDAVQAAIRVMEDSPLFNAGKGAVFAHNGKNELDAALMDGSTLKAGAVAGVEHIKNPIDLARLVMEKTPHVMLMGEGAEEFARSQGVPLVPASYFFTQRRWDELQRALKMEADDRRASLEQYPGTTAHGFGTVGAVALDRRGELAAGTSTGGLNNKYYGRVGDSPIIGAGTYADGRSCGVSGTGTGEYFIRLGLAKGISDLMRFKGMSVQAAADQLVLHDLVELGGADSGGAIAMDKDGNIRMPFNTEGMYRAYIDTAGKEFVAIYKDE
ncbi:MAG TPA: isoaspartyl peptidase/L-asparaginase [Gammaproteobacteria bacterium]|jgi:beta-aspartyl-peptidase (threonine type)|nr:isoaspartyl peptidase/L-asparaginase [Gammaproteobacteria bacterium]